MHFPMRLSLVGLFALAPGFLSLSARAAITFAGPTSYIPHVDCIRPDGGYTDVTAFSWKTSGELDGSALWTSITDQTSGEFPPQWGYTFGDALGGTLNIDKYEAFDKDFTDTGLDYCKHGVQMNATLTGVTGLPVGQSLNWFQVYRENGNSISRGHAANDWTIDPGWREVVSGTEEDDAPFYYNQSEEGILHPNATTWKFGDGPSDVFRDPTIHAGSIEFFTFLASWDGNYEATEGGAGSHVVTIYGGWSWGYSYQCPEPSFAAPFAVIALMVLRRRRRTCQPTCI